MSSSIAEAHSTPVNEAGSEMKDGDRVYFRRNYKTEDGVYALIGDSGTVSGSLVYEDGKIMAYIVELDRPRVKGFETLYVADNLLTPATTNQSDRAS